MLSPDPKFTATIAEFTPLGICWKCAHKHLGAATCAAFPAGIPQAVILGDVDHREPVEDDNGIQFEPIAETNDD